jgi:hypothetical protein
MDPASSIDAALRNYLTTANWEARQDPDLTRNFALLAIAWELSAIREVLAEQRS